MKSETLTERRTMISLFGLTVPYLTFLPADSAREITISRIDGVLTATYANGTTLPVKIKLAKKIENAATGRIYSIGNVVGADINAYGTFVLA